MLSFDILKTRANLSDLEDAQHAITDWLQAFLKMDINSFSSSFTHYQDISQTLNEIKADAQDWIKLLGPDITSHIPQGIYNFASHFIAIVPEITGLVEYIIRNKQSNNADIKKRELIQLLSMLHAKAIDQKFTIQRFSNLYHAFVDNLCQRIKKVVFESVSGNADQMEEQMSILQRLQPPLTHFDAAISQFTAYLPEISNLWDAFINRIMWDIQSLKEPDSDVALILDLQTLSQATENWKMLEQVAVYN